MHNKSVHVLGRQKRNNRILELRKMFHRETGRSPNVGQKWLSKFLKCQNFLETTFQYHYIEKSMVEYRNIIPFPECLSDIRLVSGG
jgi:hypothetical protein